MIARDARLGKGLADRGLHIGAGGGGRPARGRSPPALRIIQIGDRLFPGESGLQFLARPRIVGVAQQVVGAGVEGLRDSDKHRASRYAPESLPSPYIAAWDAQHPRQPSLCNAQKFSARFYPLRCHG